MNEFFELKYTQQFLQDFNDICEYSCSKNGEVRNFKIFKTFYLLKIWKLELKVFRRLKVQCSNCGKITFLPQSFAKSIFKNGLKSDLLLKFSNDRILNSWSLNFLAKFWILFGLLLVLLIVFIGVRLFTEPVKISDPIDISFDELKGNSYIGKIVRVSGKVDYTLAFTKDEVERDSKGNINLKSQEAYLPIFSSLDQLDFAVIRGGNNELSNILNRTVFTNSELLKNQDYQVIGKVELIDNLNNDELKNYYKNELPSAQNLNPPQILINSADIVDVNVFINRYIYNFTILLILTILSFGLQFYLDIRIRETKNRL